MADWAETLTRFDTAIYRLTNRYYWARRTLRSLQPMETHAGTLRVDQWHRVMLNPEYLDTITDQEFDAVVWHETGHLLRRHHERFNDAAEADKRWVNIAADLEINGEIRQWGVETLPEGIIFPEMMGLEAGRSAEEYLTYLLENQPEDAPSPGMGDPQDGNKDGSTDDSGDQEGDGEATDQGVEGTGTPTEGDQSGAGDPSDSGGDGDSVPDYHGCGAGSGGDDPDQLEPPTDEQQARLNREQRHEDEELVKEYEGEGFDRATGYSKSGIPEVVYKAAKERLGVQKHDWRQTIGIEVRNAIEQVSDEQEEYTFRRQSRRQSAFDDLRLPGAFRPVPKLGVVLDVSGSMNEPKVRTALRELHGILERLAIPAFTVYPWSTRMATEQPVSVETGADIDRCVEWVGGGTNMESAVQYAVQEGREEIVVVLTDCECSWDRLNGPDVAGVPLIIGGIDRRDYYELPKHARIVDIDVVYDEQGRQVTW